MKRFFTSQVKIASITAVITFSIIICIVICAVLFSTIISLITSKDTQPQLSYQTTFGNYSSSNKFLAIPITGTIVGSANEVGTNILSTVDNTAGYDVADELHEAAQDTSIKGIILEINSPGGELSGAHAIADGVAQYKAKTKKPVIAFISGLGASGAYWAAISADYVFADYGSESGDIGVISGPFAYYDKVTAVNNGVLDGGVVTQNGIQETYIYAGQSKDLGNPYRQMTMDEVAILQLSVDSEYTLFVTYVSQRRHISAALYSRNERTPLGFVEVEVEHFLRSFKVESLSGTIV